MDVLGVPIFLAGLSLAAGTIFSALETFVLPRSVSDWLTRIVFLGVRMLFAAPLRMARSYAGRDRWMAFYAPVSLITLVPIWYLLVALGYTAMYWALGVRPWSQAFILSGSSLLTLGFSPPTSLFISMLVFSEAILGLLLVALLIAYLPTMYAAFQRRETAVTLLEVRAGDPPSAIELVLRYQRIHGLQRMGDLWPNWELWFADIDESHTSLPALVYFRSHLATHSWVTAAGAVLDAAALTLAAVDIPPEPAAMLCIRAGFLALRNIADTFGLPNPNNPHYPQHPISIRRDEFDEALNQLAQAGVPLKQDCEQAWQDFAGWRVNYDQSLLGLCTLTLAPMAAWSSDRAIQTNLPAALGGVKKRRRS